MIWRSDRSLFTDGATWHPDQDDVSCHARLCGRELKRRERYHCRWCGHVFCDRCAPKSRRREGAYWRCCNVCRLPEVLRATPDPVTGILCDTAFHVICSFLAPKDINALLQSCYTMLSTFPVSGLPYHATLQERFPYLYPGAVVGTGRFGTVFKCQDLEDPEKPYVAVKTLTKSKLMSVATWAKAQLEWTVLEHCCHPHIVAFRGAFQTPDTVAIVTAAANGGTLHQVAKWLASSGVPREPLVAQVLRQVALGIQYLYDNLGVVHRDIKLNNIVIDEEYSCACLIDFGLAQQVRGTSRDHWAPVGATPFASPECLAAVVSGSDLVGDGESLLRSDMYSLGVVAYTLMSDFFPFPTTHGNGQQLASQRKGPTFPAMRWKGVSMRCTDLLSALLHPDPARRPLPAAIVNDPWVREMAEQPHDFVGARRAILAAEKKLVEECW